MKIILAGYNLDYETILEFQELHPEMQNLTPETVSAAYARISRSPKLLPGSRWRRRASPTVTLSSMRPLTVMVVGLLCEMQSSAWLIATY